MKESSQNYLETIFVLKQKLSNVRSIDIANELNFSKASVSVAIKKLRESDFIIVDDSGYISLTELGEFEAKKIYDRHTTLVTLFESLGVPADIADIDACKIEHILSDITFEKLKDHLQNHNNK